MEYGSNRGNEKGYQVFLNRCQRLGIDGNKIGELEEILNELNIPAHQLCRVVKECVEPESGLDKSNLPAYIKGLATIYNALKSESLPIASNKESKIADMGVIDKYVTRMMEREDLLDKGSVGEVADLMIGIARIGDNQFEGTNLRYALKIVEEFKDSGITLYDVIEKASDLRNESRSPVKILYHCMKGDCEPVPFYNIVGNDDDFFRHKNDPDLSDAQYNFLILD